MKTYYIGADVHYNTTDIAIEHRRRIIERVTVPTTITAIRQVLEKFPGKKLLAIEESTLAGWIYRHRHQHVEQLIVSDPRRNHLIALKQWVNLYHQRVAQRTAQINRLRAQARAYGREIPNDVFKYPTKRQAWLRQQKLPQLAQLLNLLWIGFDAADHIIITKSPFSQHYERMIAHGITPSNARHTIARKLITVMKPYALRSPTRLIADF